MARAFVLETAEQRAQTFGAFLQVDQQAAVQHSYRVREGLKDRVVLSWGVDSNDWHRYLLAHYEANRRATFDVDLGDGAGVREFRYAAPPSWTSVGTSAAGTYSVTIERA